MGLGIEDGTKASAEPCRSRRGAATLLIRIQLWPLAAGGLEITSFSESH